MLRCRTFCDYLFPFPLLCLYACGYLRAYVCACAIPAAYWYNVRGCSLPLRIINRRATQPLTLPHLPLLEFCASPLKRKHPPDRATFPFKSSCVCACHSWHVQTLPTLGHIHHTWFDKFTTFLRSRDTWIGLLGCLFTLQALIVIPPILPSPPNAPVKGSSFMPFLRDATAYSGMVSCWR